MTDHATIMADPMKLLMQFESLGLSCEFGLVQRKFGIEPLGLLRFALTEYAGLMRALAADFAGLGDPATTKLLIRPGNEYFIFDTLYGLPTHTWKKPSDVDHDRFLQTVCVRQRFLAQKFRQDAGGERIMVRTDQKPITLDQIRDLHRALRRYGPAVLLQVVAASDRGEVNTIERLDRDLMLARIDHLGQLPDGRWNIALDTWLAVCRKAFLMRAACG